MSSVASQVAKLRREAKTQAASVESLKAQLATAKALAASAAFTAGTGTTDGAPPPGPNASAVASKRNSIVSLASAGSGAASAALATDSAAVASLKSRLDDAEAQLALLRGRLTAAQVDNVMYLLKNGFNSA